MIQAPRVPQVDAVVAAPRGIQREGRPVRREPRPPVVAAMRRVFLEPRSKAVRAPRPCPAHIRTDGKERLAAVGDEVTVIFFRAADEAGAGVFLCCQRDRFGPYPAAPIDGRQGDVMFAGLAEREANLPRGRAGRLERLVTACPTARERLTGRWPV